MRGISYRVYTVHTENEEHESMALTEFKAFVNEIWISCRETLTDF